MLTLLPVKRQPREVERGRDNVEREEKGLYKWIVSKVVWKVPLLRRK